MTDTRDPSAGGSESRIGAGGHTGPVSRGQLLSLIAAGDVETVVLAAPDRYARLFGKRVHAPFFAEGPEQGMLTCSVNVAWDLGQDFVGHLDYTGWHTGYHDMLGRPDMATARVLPWADKTALILCDLVEEDGADIPVVPRTMLRTQLERAAAAGFTCKTASELEFHVFRETYDEARAKGYRDLTPAPGYATTTSFSPNRRRSSRSSPTCAACSPTPASRWSAARASTAGVRLRSTCATPRPWSPPTVTCSTRRASRSSPSGTA